VTLPPGFLFNRGVSPGTRQSILGSFAQRLANYQPSERAKRRMELYLPSTDMFSDDTMDGPEMRVFNAILQEQAEHWLAKATGTQAPKAGGWFG
jgi:hypothetical protein